jgi:hypothetical protein
MRNFKIIFVDTKNKKNGNTKFNILKLVYVRTEPLLSFSPEIRGSNPMACVGDITEFSCPNCFFLCIL